MFNLLLDIFEIIRMTIADVILNAAARKAEKEMLRLKNFWKVR
jgi:CRISPR/Cas system-associated endonuclease Cas1